MGPRPSARRTNANEQQTQRAEALTALGELSSARQALEAAEIAPGIDETFNILSNLVRRPIGLKDLFLEVVQNFVPDVAFLYDFNRFEANVRGA